MKRLLIVVDFQKDFVDGALGFAGAEKLEGPILEKIAAYREAGDLVWFTFDTHHPDYLDTQEGRKLPIPHCLDGTPGWKLYGKVADAQLDIDEVFLKPTFGSVDLCARLAKAQQIALSVGTLPFESIELVGLVSSICVLSNAVIARASCPDVPIIVDAACTAAADPVMNEKALDVMENLQIEVVNR